MIYLVNGSEKERYPEWIEAMHRTRATVFKERLGWDVVVEDGIERDALDDLNPLYVLSIGRQGRLQGSLRLLPTTGPNMLRDVFPTLLPPDETVESPTIWESSRFAIDPATTDRDANTLLNPVTFELLIGIVEVGLMAGLSTVVTVVDARMKRILRMADFPIDYIGTPQRIGKAMAYAALLEVSEEAWASLAAKSGIRERVISQDSLRPAVAA